MKYLALILSLSFSIARAEVSSEHFVTVGIHKLVTVSLREHQVSNGKGYSIVKSSSKGEITARKITANQYQIFKKELEQIAATTSKTQQRSVANSCTDPVILGSKKKKNITSFRTVCFENQSDQAKKSLTQWWSKVTREL
jgi:hypothetical protein